MGVGPKLGCRSSSRYDNTYSGPANPDPDRYTLLDAFEYDNRGTKYVVLKVKYDGCTTFEGTKILVYQNTTLLELVKQKSLDPHFSDSKTKIHPIARFSPGNELAKDWGWDTAKDFVQQNNISCFPYYR